MLFKNINRLLSFNYDDNIAAWKKQERMKKAYKELFFSEIKTIEI